MNIKKEIEEIYNSNKKYKLHQFGISQEAELDIEYYISSICKEKTGPITDEEKKCWNNVYKMLNNINIDELYDNVKFYQSTIDGKISEEVLPMHKRKKEEVYNDNDCW